MTEPRFWRELLKQRATHSWGNFSWLSLSTVLASANDTLAKLDGGRIIDSRRMRWVAAQRAAGRDPDAPVLMPAARSLLLLGDPGEMDPSQYVLLRDLHAAEADALLLMSDIVYPAGDINAWRDAVYLPYLGKPAEAWQLAREALQAAGGGSGAAARSWPIFAMPGNHDWYDGLTGFMYHACSAEPLPPVAYSSAGLGFVQRLTRRAWQNPARPDRPMLEPLRAAAAACWDDPGAVSGPIPHQTGPYFAIDVGSVGSGKDKGPALRFLLLDTGVDGSIDTEQELWVRKMLRGRVPKIVVTGKPLITGNAIHDMPVNPPLPGHDKHWEPRGLMDLLGEASAQMVVATVAGDIHNAQRMVLAGRLECNQDREPPGRRRCTVRIDDGAFAKARARRLAPVNVVAGGGGAYLSGTHTTRLAASDVLVVEGNDTSVQLCAEAHHRFPSREVSAQHFAATMGGWTGTILTVVGFALAGVVLLTVWQGAAATDRDVRIDEQDLSLWHVVGAAYASVLFVSLCAHAVSQWRRRRTRAALVVSAAAIAALCVTMLLWDVDFEDASLLLVGTGLAIATPLLPLALPVLRAFPLLQRYVPMRLLLGTALGALGAWLTAVAGSFEQLTVLLLGGLIAAVVGAVFVRWLVAFLVKKHDDWAVGDVKRGLRRLLVALSLWPVALIGLLVLVVRSSEHLEGFDYLVALMVLLDLSAIVVVVTFVLARTLVGAHRFAPLRTLQLVVFGAVAGGVLTGLFADDLLEFPDWPKHLAAGLTSGAALLLALTGVLLRASTQPALNENVASALHWRDTRTGAPPRGLDVFRTMTVAAVPVISEIAEATKPPFHKSFLTVEAETNDARTTAIVFRIFGVDDERSDTTVTDQDPPKPDAQQPVRGAFLVDELSVRLEQ